MIRRTFTASVLVLCVPAWSAEADEPALMFDYALRSGLAYSDNVFLSPDGAKRDALSLFAGARINGARPVGRLRYDLDTDLTASKYFRKNVNQTLHGSARLNGAYDFVPEVFGWTAGFSFDQYREDVLRGRGPGNTDNTVRFSTGPTLRLQLSSRTRAELDASYSLTTYSDRPQDSENLGGRVALLRQVGPRVSLGVGASADDVSYRHDTAGLFDYERQEAFVTSDVRGVRTSAHIEAGYSRLKDDASKKSDGLMFRSTFSRRLTPSLSASLGAAREYAVSDEYDVFLRPLLDNDVDPTPVTVGARLTKSFNVGLSYQLSRTGLSIGVSRRDEDGSFSGAGRRKFNLLNARLSRRFTERMQGSLDAAMTDERFSAFTGKANDNIFGGELGWNVGERLSVGLRLEHRSRDGIFATGDYSEFRGNLFFSYGRRAEPSN